MTRVLCVYVRRRAGARAMTRVLYVCDNCGRTSKNVERDLISAPDLGARLDPGSVVPDGECPTCGAFVYRQTVKR